MLNAFLAEHGFVALSYQGAMIPLHAAGRPVERRIGDARVLLVGDAAGHVKVTTVGGLVAGLWGASAAARSLIQGTRYRRELRGLEQELRLHSRLRWLLNRFSDALYGDLLASLNQPLLEFLGRRNRDSMAGAAWHLLLAQPRLLGLGLRAVRGARAAGARRGLAAATVAVEGVD